MGIRVVTQKDLDKIESNKKVKMVAGHGETTEQPKTDDQLSAIIKYIPAEVVAAWTAVNSTLATQTNIPDSAYWIVFFIGLIWVFVTRALLTPDKDNGLGTSWSQVTISTIAFVIWNYTLGKPFNFLAGYQVIYGTVAVLIFSGISPQLAKMLDMIPSAKKTP